MTGSNELKWCDLCQSLHTDDINEFHGRIIKQYKIADDWYPLRPDMREVAEAMGFEIREEENEES